MLSTISRILNNDVSLLPDDHLADALLAWVQLGECVTVLETFEIMVFITPYGVYFENPVTILPKSVATRYSRRVRGGTNSIFHNLY